MPHIYSNIVLDNIAADSLLYIMDPPQGWANLTDCIDFPCTAPQNVILQFRDGITIKGTSPSNLLPASSTLPYDIVSDNPGFKSALTHCTKKDDWNANVCTGDDMAMLVF